LQYVLSVLRLQLVCISAFFQLASAEAGDYRFASFIHDSGLLVLPDLSPHHRPCWILDSPALSHAILLAFPQRASQPAKPHVCDHLPFSFLREFLCPRCGHHPVVTARRANESLAAAQFLSIVSPNDSAFRTELEDGATLSCRRWAGVPFHPSLAGPEVLQQEFRYDIQLLGFSVWHRHRCPRALPDLWCRRARHAGNDFGAVSDAVSHALPAKHCYAQHQAARYPGSAESAFCCQRKVEMSCFLPY